MVILDLQGIELVRQQDDNLTLAPSQEDPHGWVNQHMRR